MNFEKLRLTCIIKFLKTTIAGLNTFQSSSGLSIRDSFCIAVLFIPSFNVLSRYVNLVAVTELFSSGTFMLFNF